MRLEKALEDFSGENRMDGKGPLSVALVVTRRAKTLDFPLNPEVFLTNGGGQVVGLGKSAVQTILKDHGITRVLAEEGGRTSRGSVGKMKHYVEFLNQLSDEFDFDLDKIEAWWIQKVRKHFAAKPFILRYDPSKSTRAIIRDLLNQAEARQTGSPGSTCLGTMLQHLVGAKLDILLGPGLEHHGASVADEATGRDGDFPIDDVAIHVTTAPTEALLRKCSRNLEKGLKPVIITTTRGRPLADGLSEQAGIADRVDVFEAEQFIAGNLYEIGRFQREGRKATAQDIVSRYNEILDLCETDPGLKIEMSE